VRVLLQPGFSSSLFAGAALRVTVASVIKIPRPRSFLLPMALIVSGSPAVAAATPRATGFASFSTWLLLPFLVAFAVAGHILIGRGAKALTASFQPLASGELELASYDRHVYGTSDRAMLEIVVVPIVAGLVIWIGVGLSFGWLIGLGILGVLGAVAFDLARWERVSVSASYVWFQRGFTGKVHQVAIENIRDVSVVEEDGTLPTLRHLNNNRVCRLLMRMTDKRAVALPKTDAETGLEAVENAANQIRWRLQALLDKQNDKRGDKPASARAAKGEPGPVTRPGFVATRPGPPDTAPAAAPDPDGGRIPTAGDKEMLRELRRLRKQRAAAAAADAGQPPKARADSEF
jgi:hypothetical protein